MKEYILYFNRFLQKIGRKNSLNDIVNAFLGYIVAFFAEIIFLSPLLKVTGENINFFSSVWIANSLVVRVLFEEFIFRYLIKRFVYYYFDRKISPLGIRKIYLVSSSFLFAISHSGNILLQNDTTARFVFFIIYFIAGLYFAYLYISTSTILLSSFMHTLNNLFATFVVSADNLFPFGMKPRYIINIKPNIMLIVFVLLPLLSSFIFFKKDIVDIQKRI